MGAYHSSELPMLFGTHALNGESDDFEVTVSEAMQDAYLAFARDSEKGLDELDWEAYELTERKVREFGATGVVEQMVALTEIEDECAALGLA